MKKIIYACLVFVTLTSAQSRADFDSVDSYENNPILDTDSYKASHWEQYPEGTTATFSYLESRKGGRYDKTVFFGLQYLLKKYLSKPITQAMVEEAKSFFEAHGEPFNYAGWTHIVRTHGGYLPIKIRAVPEGTVVPTDRVLMTVESTDAQTYWLPSWMETQLMRVWYPTTVATISWHTKQTIKRYLDQTSDNPQEQLPFKLHDFGSRGVSSRESAGIGGAAHLVNFKGSDTVMGVLYANKYYKSLQMAGYSIPAAEHSTITSHGPENEASVYRKMISLYGGSEDKKFAVVSDSYNYFNAVSNIWGKELKQEVINSKATIIIRPDSGEPVHMVLESLKRLDESFGHQTNSKGFKVLNQLRVLQGDGINEDTVEKILFAITEAGYSTDNVAFGMGGGLLQKLDRDTQRFAYKTSSITIQGKDFDVFKNPFDAPEKASKRGKLDLLDSPSEGLINASGTDHSNSALRVVYDQGKIMIEDTFDDIRRRSEK